MNLSTIIFIIIAFVLGAIISFFLKKGKTVSPDNSENENALSELVKENENLKTEILKIKSEKDAENEDKLNKLKEKYEKLIQEANRKSEDLEERIKSFLEKDGNENLKNQIDEIEKLKKEIKKLNDEIEEHQDSIEDYEDKIEKQKKELSEKDKEYDKLDKDFRDKRKENTAIKEELEELKESLKEKKNELDLKIDSINFIQEVLSAKKTNNLNYNKLAKDIDRFEYFLRGSYFDMITYLYDVIIKEQNKNELEEIKTKCINGFNEWASTRKKDWLYNKTTIAIVGEFSAGKTSIVNRILSQDDPKIPRLPVSTKATTAIATYISGGDDISYNFISGDNNRKEISEETFKKISKEVLDQVKGISSLIKYFVMTYKNENLKGLSVLDTPGFSSNDKEDSERTIEVINECDALFWVFDVNNGTVNRSSLAVIKENLRRPIYVVINKVDTKAESEVQGVEDLIRKTFKEEGMEVQQFIRFSSEADLSNIMDPIKSIKKNDIRENFINELSNIIGENVKNFSEASKALNIAYNEANKIIDTLEVDFKEHIQAITEESEALCDSIKFKSPVFGSDRYELSIRDGRDLKDLLRHLFEEAPDILITMLNDLVKYTKESKALEIDYKDAKTAHKLAIKCSQEFEEIMKEFSK